MSSTEAPAPTKSTPDTPAPSVPDSKPAPSLPDHKKAENILPANPTGQERIKHLDGKAPPRWKGRLRMWWLYPEKHHETERLGDLFHPRWGTGE